MRALMRVWDVFAVPLIVLASLQPASATTLGANCVVSVLNRSVEVRPDGSWVVPNIPANLGRVRARATCVNSGITASGQSDYFLVPANGVLTDVPPIVFDVVAPIPLRLTLTASSAALIGAGSTLQLTTLAIYQDG